MLVTAGLGAVLGIGEEESSEEAWGCEFEGLGLLYSPYWIELDSSELLLIYSMSSSSSDSSLESPLVRFNGLGFGSSEVFLICGGLCTILIVFLGLGFF